MRRMGCEEDGSEEDGGEEDGSGKMLYCLML